MITGEGDHIKGVISTLDGGEEGLVAETRRRRGVGRLLVEREGAITAVGLVTPEQKRHVKLAPATSSHWKCTTLHWLEVRQGKLFLKIHLHTQLQRTRLFSGEASLNREESRRQRESPQLGEGHRGQIAFVEASWQGARRMGKGAMVNANSHGQTYTIRDSNYKWTYYGLTHI